MQSRISVMGALFLVGCATTAPPSELVFARTEYARASQGTAATLAPEELHKAKLALDAAEQSYAAHPKDAASRDLAYVAERKAQLAAAKGRLASDRNAKAQADENYRLGLAQTAARTQAELERAREQAAEADQKRQAELAAAEERLRTETERRTEAERRAEAATQDLARLAETHQEERGLVVTLSGDVLFATDQWALLPSAQLRLNQVADALEQTDQKLVIEGHTDARGSDEHNQQLSTLRAQAVRDYLVGRGIPAERVQVAGYGESRPVADNTSPEGRALNRRVEIVIEGKSTAKR